MLVMNVIAEILKKEGVSTLFCFPTAPIIEAAAAVGDDPVEALLEERDRLRGSDPVEPGRECVDGRPAGCQAEGAERDQQDRGQR